jgi:hypothetical protein
VSEPDWLLRHRATRLSEQAAEERAQLILKSLTNGLTDEERRRLEGLITEPEVHLGALRRGPSWP